MFQQLHPEYGEHTGILTLHKDLAIINSNYLAINYGLTGKSNYFQKGKDNQAYSTMNVLKEFQVDFGC